MNQRFYFLLILLISFPCLMHAMVFDNRYFPLVQEPYVSIPERPSHVRTDLFVTTGSRAHGQQNGVNSGIPEMYGQFNLSLLAQAFELADLPNPLTPTQTISSLPYILQGKVQTQGVSFSFYQNVKQCIGVGAYLMVMQANSSLNFLFNTRASTDAPAEPVFESELIVLENNLRHMLATLGLSANHVHQVGFGDIELFSQWGDRWEYIYKLRSVESWLRLGLLIPTGQRKNIFEPASVPFGGDGFWGAYASIFGECEIREDWKIGVLLRASKRFARVRQERMPIAKEQPLFGVLVGRARVDPGFTGIFSPYISFENLRAGLGFRFQYTLIGHMQDSICNRCVKAPFEPNLVELRKTSRWASEYITFTGFYDFGKMKVERCSEPIIVFSWYVPYSLLVAKDSVDSYKVSLGVEYSF